jgi:hypothetical protein
VSSDEFAVLTEDVGGFEGFVVVTSHERLEADRMALREMPVAAPFESRVTPYRLHRLGRTIAG